ncbi:hypothetical protein MsAg5_16470 [Methanosarcinaceae archaeon Ag5]|uniref:Uncharacterized protein n=1 Tax=Methanolapillus africanus TaxID=3028297 RepID=A0AAE4MJH6_9EURY|nr:hypothetical protein [Methanosarcinaceae archaeon Ag5]
MKMKMKILLIGVLVFLFVFAAGCLNSNNGNTTENNATDSGVKYNSSYVTARYMPPPIPRDQQSIYLLKYPNYDYASPQKDGLENDSDLIVYATIKEIQPASWSTADGKMPAELREKEIQIVTENGPVDYKVLWSDGYEDIYTDVIFTVDEWAKGNSSDEIKVRFTGGQVDNVVRDDLGFPDPRNLEVGDQYLLYLTYYSDAYELRYPNGIETITVKN